VQKFELVTEQAKQLYGQDKLQVPELPIEYPPRHVVHLEVLVAEQVKHLDEFAQGVHWLVAGVKTMLP
jgi:hypothetical protein